MEMTQVEFEKQLADLKAAKNREMEAIESWQVELKQKLADWQKRRTEAEGAISRLKAEKAAIASRRVELERKWSAKIEKFKAENFSETRELESISDFALVKEMAKRGWQGSLYNLREDMTEEHKKNVKDVFLDTHIQQREGPKIEEI